MDPIRKLRSQVILQLLLKLGWFFEEKFDEGNLLVTFERGSGCVIASFKQVCRIVHEEETAYAPIEKNVQDLDLHSALDFITLLATTSTASIIW